MSELARAEIAVEGTPQRDVAIARSLGSAQARAEQRVKRFVDAARELLAHTDIGDLTVQQVAKQSGQSLRSFYQYFSGKHELLLTVFEEDVAWTAQHVDQMVSEVDDPIEGLQLIAIECHRLALPPPPGSSSNPLLHPTTLAEFAQQLLTRHSREAAQAFRPLVDVLERQLREAGAAGVLRPGLDYRRVAGILLQGVMFDAFAATISGSHLGLDDDDVLWQLALHGLVST